MMMNGFDTNFDADNEVYAVNTVANHFMHEPDSVEVGKLVRMYLVNVTEFDLINSLHLHGMFFDVFRTGTRMTTHGDRPTPSCCARASARSSRRGSAIPATSCSTLTRASLPSSAGWASSKPWERVVTPEAPSPTAPRRRASGSSR